MGALAACLDVERTEHIATMHVAAAQAVLDIADAVCKHVSAAMHAQQCICYDACSTMHLLQCMSMHAYTVLASHPGTHKAAAKDLRKLATC